MPRKEQLTITDQTGRLDKVLSSMMPDESRSQLKLAIDEQRYWSTVTLRSLNIQFRLVIRSK